MTSGAIYSSVPTKELVRIREVQSLVFKAKESGVGEEREAMEDKLLKADLKLKEDCDRTMVGGGGAEGESLDKSKSASRI